MFPHLSRWSTLRTVLAITISQRSLIVNVLLSLMSCLYVTSEGQQRKQLSAPKLELTGVVRNSEYCSASNLRLTLQLSFHNPGLRPVLLRKDGFRVGRYKVSRDEQQLRAGKYELNVAPMMNSVGILKYRLEDKATDQSAFITLEPTATHKVLIQLNIPFIEESKQRSQDSLAPGDYVLQVLVWTWLDSQSFATQSREKWKDRGYLWTKSITSEPMPFTVTKERIISACN